MHLIIAKKKTLFVVHNTENKGGYEFFIWLRSLNKYASCFRCIDGFSVINLTRRFLDVVSYQLKADELYRRHFAALLIAQDKQIQYFDFLIIFTTLTTYIKPIYFLVESINTAQ